MKFETCHKCGERCCMIRETGDGRFVHTWDCQNPEMVKAVDEATKKIAKGIADEMDQKIMDSM